MRSFDPPRRRLAMGLAVLAGLVDATGFLAADAYFVSFMSGNTTRLAVNLIDNPSRAFIPALLILGFLIGVVLGALLAERAGSRRKTAVLALASGLLLLAAGLHEAGWKEGFLAASVLAMGALNNTFRKNGEVAVAVTYMTGAVVRFGQGLAAWLQGRPRVGWLDNAALWASLLAGGVLGAWLFLATQLPIHWLSVGAATALLGAAWRIERADRYAAGS